MKERNKDEKPVRKLLHKEIKSESRRQHQVQICTNDLHRKKAQKQNETYNWGSTH